MASVFQERGVPARVRAIPAPDSVPVVKSAGRVLQILEYFDDVRRSATAAEIAHYFHFPQSSTSQLLRSMLVGGYLQFDRATRRYGPSVRVSLLGSWCDDRFVDEGSLLKMMRRLNQRTGRAVFLASQVQSHAQYVHIFQAQIPDRPHLTLGTTRPLSTSGAGIALLSTMDDAEATRFVLRNNAERTADATPASVRAVLAMLADVRRLGYVCFFDPEINAGVLSAPLPARAGRPRVAVCLGDHMDLLDHDRQWLTNIFLEEITAHNAQHLEAVQQVS
ncbi:helix-turn-helix domain-containing protein [soil metagenome]